MKVVLLFGPTGVGKTELLARLFSGRAEVISADAFQVYRGLDIGTAKPGAELRAGLPHHLLDIRDFHQGFNAGEFSRLADDLVTDISGRGRIPVVSGGSAFYMKTWLFGLPELPPTSIELRKSLSERCDRVGLAAMRNELMIKDPRSARRIGEGDRVRILRALEVEVLTGRPLSSFPLPEGPRTDMDILMLGINRDRTELHSRIDRRVKKMFREGLADELNKLFEAGARREHSGMRGIGYREWFLPSGGIAPASEELQKLIISHTRQYAGRQMTFFRSLPAVRWFDGNDEDGVDRTVNAFSENS